MIRSKLDSLMVRTNRSAYAFRFGDRGGRRTTCTSAAASVSRKARVNRGSRSWIRKRFPVRKPSPTSVRLRPFWLIQALDQRADLAHDRRPSGTTTNTAVVSLGDEGPVPRLDQRLLMSQ